MSIIAIQLFPNDFNLHSVSLQVGHQALVEEVIVVVVVVVVVAVGGRVVAFSEMSDWAAHLWKHRKNVSSDFFQATYYILCPLILISSIKNGINLSKYFYSFHLCLGTKYEKGKWRPHYNKWHIAEDLNCN